jgi:phage baseplate assembly protein V
MVTPTDLTRLMRPMVNRLRLLVARGIITFIDPSGGLQRLQTELLKDELRDGLEQFEGYGFTAHPPRGLEALVLFLGGDRSHGVVVAVGDRKFRLKGLEEGEVALYTDEGDKLIFRRGRTLEIETMTLTVSAGTKVRFNTPQLEVTGEIIDRVASGGRTMSGMRDLYNAHTHPGDSGGTTGTPNGGGM